MSRYCGERATGPILDSAELWRDNCLLGGKALFSDGEIWSPEHLAELDTHYVQNLDEGEGNFLNKLEQQLAPASPGAKQLAAEMLWVMLLCLSNIKPSKKVDIIDAVYSWSGSTLDKNHELLSDDVLSGIGSAGFGYNNLRWRELRYFIWFLQAFQRESAQSRAQLLEDVSSFQLWIERVPENEQRQLRHMLLFLLFPDHCERIFGKSDRVKCASAFSGLSQREVQSLSARELDEQLAQARARMVEEYETEELDWYISPLRPFWINTGEGAADGESFYPVLEKFIEQSKDGSLRTASYPNEFKDLEVRVSFGQGNQAHVTWIAFLAEGQSPTRGIYPVYLYYKAQDILVLAKGISATNVPDDRWPESESEAIDNYFQRSFGESAKRYGDSLIYTLYDLSEPLDSQEVNSDLAELIAEYKELTLGNEPNEAPDTNESPPQQPYSLENAMEGLFLADENVQNILSTLKLKKNVILQGPPGVGKTFVSRRLAYALIGEKASHQVGMVQFHQSYSYEDFVQGFRPGGDGFHLKDGVFYSFCQKAQQDPDNTYVFIIDEINRGNLSKIFGELMMLVEHDKRGPNWAMPLTYSEDNSDPFYVPSNLYLIGLMNTADRSLAMVDYALRRRFSFMDLEPEFQNIKFKDYLSQAGVEDALVSKIVNRMTALNAQISEDKANLGPGFCIGHSFFTPSSADNGPFDDRWYQRIIRNEIEPLLREYWFDDHSKAEAMVAELLG